MKLFFYAFTSRFIKERDGAAAIEFALVGIPFLLMLFGIMEAGRIMWAMNGVQYAAEETGRYASLNSDLTTEILEDYAAEKLSEMSIASSSLQLTSSVTTSNGIDFVEIDADYEVSTMLNGLLPGDFGNFEFTTTVRKPVIN